MIHNTRVAEREEGNMTALYGVTGSEHEEDAILYVVVAEHCAHCLQ